MTPSEPPKDTDTNIPHTYRSLLKPSRSSEEDDDDQDSDNSEVSFGSIEDPDNNDIIPITATHTSPVHKSDASFDNEEELLEAVEATTIDEDGSTYVPPILDPTLSNKSTTPEPPMTTLAKRSTQYIPQKIGKKAPVQETAAETVPNSSGTMRVGTAILILIACIANTL
jgi:hypothetical protein